MNGGWWVGMRDLGDGLRNSLLRFDLGDLEGFSREGLMHGGTFLRAFPFMGAVCAIGRASVSQLLFVH